MGKRAKVKPKVDYRYRWPTQQTLVESRVSLETPRLKWRWKFRVTGWLRRLKRRSSPEPGKSTHPYDTGLGERGSHSGSGSSPISTLTQDGQRRRKLLSRMPHTAPSPAPVPKISLIKEEPRPETPVKTPVQLLRLLTSPRKSPLPRSRNATPFDFDKATVRFTNSRAQAQDLQPKAARPVAKTPDMPSTKFKSFVRRIFKRGSRRRAARSLVRH
ncbi:hypothetical protein F4823DRAFT_597056, partial [Ustulina deusta]